uniref:Uncharacterized protein n=1 Tax=Arundo donax TaxID=35708 RepID=A0A0A9GZW0_ARUDO
MSEDTAPDEEGRAGTTEADAAESSGRALPSGRLREQPRTSVALSEGVPPASSLLAAALDGPEEEELSCGGATAR